jgi:hypothetical protein
MLDFNRETKMLDLLEKYRVKGLKHQAKLLYLGGEPLTTEDLMSLFDADEIDINEAREYKFILGIKDIATEGYLYPRQQFCLPFVRTAPFLRTVLRILDTDNCWVQLAWLSNKHEILGNQTPFDLLHNFGPAKVIRLARTYGKHGCD